MTTKMTPMKTMLNTTKNMALTFALTLAPLGLALGAVTVAPGVASAASACSGTSPLAFSVPDPLEAWMYFPPAYPGGAPSLTFKFQNQQEPLTFPTGPDYATIGANWGGVDNPAPLIWYVKNVPTGNLGCIAFGNGITYTASLISKMNADGFAPSEIGGVNPAGITSTTTSSITPTPTTPKGTSTPSTSTTGGGTPSKPSGGNGMTPSPTPTPSTTVTPASPQPPIALVPPTASQWRHYQEILANDQQVIKVGKHVKTLPPPHGTVWPYAVAGVIVIGVAVFFLQRRRRAQSVDDINVTLGGRRNF